MELEGKNLKELFNIIKEVNDAIKVGSDKLINELLRSKLHHLNFNMLETVTIDTAYKLGDFLTDSKKLQDANIKFSNSIETHSRLLIEITTALLDNHYIIDNTSLEELYPDDDSLDEMYPDDEESHSFSNDDLEPF